MRAQRLSRPELEQILARLARRLRKRVVGVVVADDRILPVLADEGPAPEGRP